MARYSQGQGYGTLHQVNPLRGRVHVKTILLWNAKGNVSFHLEMILRPDLELASNFLSA